MYCAIWTAMKDQVLWVYRNTFKYTVPVPSTQTIVTLTIKSSFPCNKYKTWWTQIRHGSPVAGDFYSCKNTRILITIIIICTSIIRLQPIPTSLLSLRLRLSMSLLPWSLYIYISEFIFNKMCIRDRYTIMYYSIQKYIDTLTVIAFGTLCRL